MTYDVVMPQLGLTMEEGAVVSWQKQVGDWVKKGEVLFVVETDKTEMEVESSDSGYLNAILVETGKKVRVGTVIAGLGDRPGEVSSGAPSGETAGGGASYAHALLEIPATLPAGAGIESGGAGAHEPAAPQEEFAASPRARRLAKELGIDIRTVKPASGRRIVEEDVRRHRQG